MKLIPIAVLALAGDQCYVSLTFLVFSFSTEQNEPKHDSSSSPGMTDQEKEVAASAYESFSVHHTFSFLTYLKSHPQQLQQFSAITP